MATDGSRPGQSSAAEASPGSAVGSAAIKAVQPARGLVARLPKPSVPSGPSITFSPAIWDGTSMFGDLGSVAWNITHRDADGQLRTWGSRLYLSSTSSNALAALRHSPAVSHFCPKGATPLAGFNRADAATVAVVCPDATSAGNWWTVFARADKQTFLVLATSDSSRAETVATGTAVFKALTAMSSRANISLATVRKLPEPTG